MIRLAIPTTFLLASFLIAGCSKNSPSKPAEEFDVVLPDPPTNLSEMDVVLYSDGDVVVGADLWLPVNDAGVTRIELSTSPGSEFMDRMMYFVGDERVATIRASREGLAGTTVELADGTFARIESVEGSAWIWTVRNPQGEEARLQANLRDNPFASSLTGTPVRAAAYQVPQNRSGRRPLRFAVTSASAPLNFVTADGAEVMDSYLGRMVSSCTTSDPAKVFCDVDISPMTGDIHVSSWVRTDFLNIPEGTTVYETVRDCQAAQQDIGRFELQIGAAGLVLGGLLGKTAVTVGGVAIGLAETLGVAGYLTEWGISSSSPQCSKYDLTSNETIRDSTLAPFRNATVDAFWTWELSGDLVDDGWRVTSMMPAGAEGLVPFDNPRVRTSSLPAVTVTVQNNGAQENGSAPPGTSDTAGSVYVADFDDRILSRQPRTTGTSNPEVRVEVIEDDAGVRISVGENNLATVDFRLNTKYLVFPQSSPNDAYRWGCKRGMAHIENVPIGTDGRFATSVSVAELGHHENHINDGDPCDKMGSLEERRELMESGGPTEFPISGQIDFTNGTGVVRFDLYEQLTGQDMSFQLRRE